MTTALEDELGDIIGKARAGRAWPAEAVAGKAGLAAGDILRIESGQWVPDDEKTLLRLASALELHGPSLADIARRRWAPRPAIPDPVLDVICLNLYMGMYPVKCYLIRCTATGATALVDTGGNPGDVIEHARKLNLRPEKILLTHTHPDHAGGLDEIQRAFKCPAWSDRDEPRPATGGELRLVTDGGVISLGQLQIRCIANPGHTPGGISYHAGRSVISGDAIFAGSMGRANCDFPALFRAVSQKLLRLPLETALHPGHGPSTTVGEEREHNPFFAGKF